MTLRKATLSRIHFASSLASRAGGFRAHRRPTRPARSSSGTESIGRRLRAEAEKWKDPADRNRVVAWRDGEHVAAGPLDIGPRHQEMPQSRVGHRPEEQGGPSTPRAATPIEHLSARPAPGDHSSRLDQVDSLGRSVDDRGDQCGRSVEGGARRRRAARRRNVSSIPGCACFNQAARSNAVRRRRLARTTDRPNVTSTAARAATQVPQRERSWQRPDEIGDHPQGEHRKTTKAVVPSPPPPGTTRTR